MTDEELIARLRDADLYNAQHYERDPMHKQAADRIEALTKELDQHWNSFVHWRKQADDLTGQLAAAQDDAKEAEAYAEELEAKLATCEKYRDAYAECDRIGTQAVRDLEAKLAKAVEALGLIVVDNTWGLEHKTYMKCRAILAEIKGESHE